jgi:hypothetical protein
MKRIQVVALVSLTLGVAFAASVANASAAEPALVNKEGKPLVKNAYKGEGGKSTTQIQGEGSLTCGKLSINGRVETEIVLTKELIFTECEFAGSKCQTGATAGRIVFNELSSLLVYEVIKKEALEPAALVTHEHAAVIECSDGQILMIKGSWLLLASPSNTLTKSLTIIGKQSEGEQSSDEYEETRGGAIKKAGLTTTGEASKEVGKNFTEVQTGVQLETSANYEEEVQLKAAVGPELLNEEGKELVKRLFKGEGGNATVAIKGVGSLSCTKMSLTGEVTGMATLGKTLTFSGCSLSEAPCNTGEASGEVVFSGLRSLFVYELVKKEPEPAVLVTFEKPLKIECGSETVLLQGSVLLLVAPSNKLTKTLTIVGKQSEGVQASTEYEESKGGEVLKANLEAIGEGTRKFEDTVGVELEATNAYEEEVELKA